MIYFPFGFLAGLLPMLFFHLAYRRSVKANAQKFIDNTTKIVTEANTKAYRAGVDDTTKTFQGLMATVKKEMMEQKKEQEQKTPEVDTTGDNVRSY